MNRGVRQPNPQHENKNVSLSYLNKYEGLILSLNTEVPVFKNIKFQKRLSFYQKYLCCFQKTQNMKKILYTQATNMFSFPVKNELDYCQKEKKIKTELKNKQQNKQINKTNKTKQTKKQKQTNKSKHK